MSYTTDCQIVLITINPIDQLATIRIRVTRPDTEADELSANKSFERDIVMNATQLQAAMATNAGATLNGVQWWVGLRKALRQSVIDAELRPGAIGDAIRGMP